MEPQGVLDAVLAAITGLVVPAHPEIILLVIVDASLAYLYPLELHRTTHAPTQLQRYGVPTLVAHKELLLRAASLLIIHQLRFRHLLLRRAAVVG